MDSLFETHAQEFVAICENIVKTAPQQICKTYIYIDPAQLRRMLDKYKYEEADTKLRIWRNLGWLRCEPERLTRNVKIDGKQRRMAVLDTAVFRQLRELLPAGDRGAGIPEKQQ